MVSALPKSKEGVERYFSGCKKRKRFVGVKRDEYAAHIEKAKSDLSRVRSEMEASAWDWAIIKSYYAIHHAINGLLVKAEGFYSKDHTCAIVALKSLGILPEELYERLREIDGKFSDFRGLDIIYMLRKISQYDVRGWKDLTRKDAESVFSLAREVVSFAESKCHSGDIPGG